MLEVPRTVLQSIEPAEIKAESTKKNKREKINLPRFGKSVGIQNMLKKDCRTSRIFRVLYLFDSATIKMGQIKNVLKLDEVVSSEVLLY